MWEYRFLIDLNLCYCLDAREENVRDDIFLAFQLLALWEVLESRFSAFKNLAFFNIGKRFDEIGMKNAEF